jgi:dienelactone hydrolase
MRQLFLAIGLSCYTDTQKYFKMPSNRRNFLKSNIIFGFWTALLGIPTASAARTGNLNPKKRDPSMESLLLKYQECLGGPFPKPVPLQASLVAIAAKEGYRIETISYYVQAGERIEALLLIPDKVGEANPAPGIAVWHQHNGEYHLGKSEPAGLAGNPMHHTAVALVREGYVVLCPDALCFEARQDPTDVLKDGAFERFEFLREVVRGRSLAWKNIWDMKRAVDLLAGRPEVLPGKLGCYGHSMGSTHAWLLGPLEPRLKCVVGNCCLPTYEAIEEEHLIHCFPNFIPGWKQYGDTPEIAALIAPRALHLNFGDQDSGSPITSVRRGLKRIAATYEEKGVPENFSYYIEAGAGHELTETMWLHVQKCFANHLKDS